MKETLDIPKNVVEIAIETTIHPTDKSAYERLWTFNLKQLGMASMYWSGLNIGRGYKSRLVFIYRNGFRQVALRKVSFQ